MTMTATLPSELSHRLLVTNIISGVFMLLAALCVIIRFIHHQRKRRVKWDDWAILAAFITGAGAYTSGLLCAVAGYRQVEADVILQLNKCAKTGLAGEVLYTISVAFSKVSVLLFHKRIFDVDLVFRRFRRVMIVLVAGACLTYMLGLIFTETPAVALWNVTNSHKSINTVAFYVTIGTVNILIDVAVIGFVQRTVWALQMHRKLKLEISGLFSFAVLSVVVGILRVIYTGILDHNDATYTLTLAWLWATLELFLYIICGCLPIVYSLLQEIFRRKASDQPVTTASKSLEEKRYTYDALEKGEGEISDWKRYIMHTGAFSDGVEGTLCAELPSPPGRILSRERSDRFPVL
ncbi:hypothetical protein F4774DRAFT_281951 [Daldinia eschscholtzii]|nr:hypothetical protein F4774DRAFT_281951 [Daldinia eschscholtzii]